MPPPIPETNGAWRARAHRTAKNFNWDYGCDKLREIIHRRCDLGTALLIYWSGQPDFFRRYKRRTDLKVGRAVYDMLVEIERNVAADFYTHRNIPFNPFDDGGYNWCRDPKHGVFVELPESMYRGVGSPEEMAGREPLRSGIAGLPVGLAALVEADPKPQTDLDKVIAHLNSLNDKSSRDVVQKTGGTVTGVSFFANRKVANDDLRNLEWFPDLVSLVLGPQLTDRALEYLRFVPKLLILKLVSNPITDEGLAHLRHAPHLEELQLHGCRNVTDAGMVHVGKLKQLRHLDLGATKIGDAGLAHLSELSHLEHLDLMHYTKITNAGIAHLAGLQKLTYLRMSFTKVADRGLVHLESLRDMKVLVLGKTKVTEGGVARLRAALPGCNVSLGEYF